MTSGIVLAIAGVKDEGSAAGPLNGPSQWARGEREAYTTETSVRHTVVGYGIHHVMSVGWAILHERVTGEGAAHSTARVFAHAAATAGIAYYVDYHLTPRRFRPGFDKHVSGPSIVAVYASFAAGLAIAQLLRRRA